MIPKGSLLVSCIGNIGINIEEVAFNQQINAIVHNNKITSSKYLAYLLKYNQKN
ncbi:restriction endonuclease subunit S [uncultured Clostridium sp.]|uniref:restriction endonuclease subunit S n=1 Tax=uncultured Clostridium sp. TaxID=59620 RepID=UPI00345DBF25